MYFGTTVTQQGERKTKKTGWCHFQQFLTTQTRSPRSRPKAVCTDLALLSLHIHYAMQCDEYVTMKSHALLHTGYSTLQWPRRRQFSLWIFPFFFFHPFHFHNGPALILQTFYTISSLRYVNNLVNSNTLCNLFSANSTALVRCNSWEEAVNYCNPSADLGEQFHCYSAILLNMHLLHKSS